MDVIICPDCEKELHKAEGLVVVENHKLGVKSWGVKYLYLYTYKRLMEQWRQNDKDCSLSGTKDYADQVSSQLEFLPFYCFLLNVINPVTV